MRLWVVIVGMTLSGCGSVLPGNPDAGVGGDDSGPGEQLCFGTYISICFDAAASIPTAAVTLPNPTDINTDNSPLCNSHVTVANASYCVVTGKGITIVDVAAHGSRPLVLFSTAEILLTGDLNLSSNRTGQLKGAGANPADCALTAPTLGNGGAGGSFGTIGGNGSSSLPTGGTVGMHGNALAAFPTKLRGGCPGGNGGNASTVDLVGHGGNGGGAVALIGTKVTLDGRIFASGSGGYGGASTTAVAGGGGGGAGGMIVIETPSLVSMTRTKLWANGGGGGQGGETAGTQAGADGYESTSPNDTPIGGASGNNGGYGGNGAKGTSNGSDGGNQARSGGGGGGGGGGVGFIRAPGLGVTDTMMISPPSNDP